VGRQVVVEGAGGAQGENDVLVAAALVAHLGDALGGHRAEVLEVEPHHLADAQPVEQQQAGEQVVAVGPAQPPAAPLLGPRPRADRQAAGGGDRLLRRGEQPGPLLAADPQAMGVVVKAGPADADGRVAGDEAPGRRRPRSSAALSSFSPSLRSPGAGAATSSARTGVTSRNLPWQMSG
jgi:hypothetical protein